MSFPDEYRFIYPVQVRLRDFDPMGHVNNAVYATFLEQTRVGYFDEVLETPVEDLNMVVANLEIDFVESIMPGQNVEVGARVTGFSESSFVMEYEIRADSELAARGETTQVYFEPSTRESARVPDEWRESIQEYEPVDVS